VGVALALYSLIYSETRQQPMEKVVIGMLIFLVSLAQLWINHPKTFERNSRLVLVFGVILLQLAVVKLILATADSQLLRGGALVADGLSGLERQQLWKLAIPYAFAPLVLSVLLGKNHGIYAAIFVSLWGSLVSRGILLPLPGRDIDAILLIISLITGFIAVFITVDVRRRSRLVRAGFFVGLSTWVLALSFGLIPVMWGFVGGTRWDTFALQSAVAVGSGIVTAFMVSGALPIFESAFRITTNISWLELADLNHPLMKRLVIEAPGTYHHSLVVANLSEAAAEAIGASAAMCRVCSYFHDIGKLVKPEYFTENMRRDRNPHDELAPTMSALIIISHVKEGVDLALKHGLNQEIIDIIQQHHGTSLAYFFYKRALQQQEDTRAGGKIMNIREEDIPEVREETFRYSGPRPQTKEAAIISLSDCIESASRSLDRVTPQKIDQLVSDIIEKRLLDGQLRECDLTMRELEEVAESFRRTLQSMMHSRVAYPDARTERRETPAPSTRSTAVPPVSAA
jgi:putative nucleotidyltransferase with HDIG domain